MPTIEKWGHLPLFRLTSFIVTQLLGGAVMMRCMVYNTVSARSLSLVYLADALKLNRFYCVAKMKINQNSKYPQKQ